MPSSLIKPGRSHYLGIFVIALAALAYQVLLTRIFSVMLYYHFAFAGISLAMLGLTVGAERVYLKPERFSPERFELEWTKAALGFALSSVLLVIWFLCSPIMVGRWATMVLYISLLLFVIPFTYSGICVTLILTRSIDVGRLYAADLAGAALGCAGIVLALFYLDPVTILLLLAAASAYAGASMARGTHKSLTRKAKLLMMVLLLAAAVQGTLYLSEGGYLGILWAKGGPQAPVLFERWNAFSRIRVVNWDSKVPFGWGFGHHQTTQIDQRLIDIDAQAGTILSHFDGDFKPFAFLANDVINVGYHVRPVETVAIIGAGGGRDLMSALFFGAKHITALELNPAIFEALTRKFADFTGHFTERPEITLINAEARSWLGQHRPKVDLVQISLIDTWAATAAGGLTLSENRLYTLDAWKEFLGILTPKGMLVVSRWYDPEKYRGEFYRLLSLAASALQEQGIPRSEVRQHILTFNTHGIVTIVVSPTGFSPSEVEHAHQVANEQGFKILMAPDVAIDDTSRVIASGEATEAFYNSLPIDVTPTTDNRPFFFFMMRIKNALKMKYTPTYNASNDSALSIIVILLLGTLAITAAFVIDPLLKVRGRLPVKHVLADLTYFAGIGIGFMLIEISQMQRLIVFLGHPVYGLSVVLFTLLLFGGIGSATVRPEARPETLWKRGLLLCIVLCAIGLSTPAVTAQFVPFGTPARILVSLLLLAPAGFCMGMMFPAGMLMSARHRDLQPWFWGINGSTSVFASILGVVISMQFGIAAAYWSGVVCYTVCLWIAFKNRDQLA